MIPAVTLLICTTSTVDHARVFMKATPIIAREKCFSGVCPLLLAQHQSFHRGHRHACRARKLHASCASKMAPLQSVRMGFDAESKTRISETVEYFRNFPTTARVLVLGDGNLSFSLALKKNLPDIRLKATTYDSFERVHTYFGAEETIEQLRALGADVMHEVDATNIGSSLGKDFRAERIVFNFPHTGGKSNIQANRELQKHITDDGEIAVSLVAGQGGTEIDKPRVWGDTWQITAQAAYGGFLLWKCFPWFPLEQYTPTGYRSQNRQFKDHGGLMHIFVHEVRGIKAELTHSWQHDMSMWMPSKVTDEDVFKIFLADELVSDIYLNDTILRSQVKILDPKRFKLSDDYQQSRSYRVIYRSDTRAISQDLARDRQLQLRDKAAELLEVIFR